MGYHRFTQTGSNTLISHIQTVSEAETVVYADTLTSPVLFLRCYNAKFPMQPPAKSPTQDIHQKMY